MLTRMSISAQASEDVSKYLFQMKVLLYGDGGEEAYSSRETPRDSRWLIILPGAQRTSLNRRSLPSFRRRSTRTTCYNSSCRTSGGSSSRCGLCVVRDCLSLLLTRHVGLRTQARKDVSQIFNNLLRRQIGIRWPTVEHLSAKEETIFAALQGCVPPLSPRLEDETLTKRRGEEKRV